MGKPRTYSCWDTSVKIQEAGHGLCVYGNTYEILPGGGYTRTGRPENICLFRVLSV